jgi:hypothetical protein
MEVIDRVEVDGHPRIVAVLRQNLKGAKISFRTDVLGCARFWHPSGMPVARGATLARMPAARRRRPVNAMPVGDAGNAQLAALRSGIRTSSGPSNWPASTA